MGISSRTYELKGPDPLPNKYDGGIFPEITIRADIFPLVGFLDNFLRNIGLAASFTRHLSINTTPKDNTENSIDTSSWELFADLQYRWVFNDTSTSPEVSIFGGYGFRDFTLGKNPTLHSMKYQYVHLGVNGVIPLMTPLLALTAGFDVRPIISAGQEAGRFIWGSFGWFWLGS